MEPFGNEYKPVMIALSAPEEYLNNLLESITDAVFTVKMPEREIEYVNNAISQIFGYTPQEVIGKTPRLFYLNEADYVAFGEKVQNTLGSGGSNLRTEQIFRKKNGTTFWGEIATRFHTTDGKLSQIISVIRDITERKKIEQEIKFQAEILAQVSDAVVVTNNDPEHTIVYWNKGAEKLYGWKAEEVVGKPSHFLNTQFEDHDQKTTTAILTEEGGYEGEVTQARKDGTKFPSETRLISLLDDNEEIIGWIAVNRDITKRKQAEETLKRWNEELEERVKERTIELQEQMNVQKKILNLTAGREVRMAELKKVIKNLRQQLTDEGIEPLFDDPLNE